MKWIIRRQGGTYDTMVFVTWETAEDSAGELEVRWDSDTEHIISEFDEWDTGLEDPEFDTNAIGAELFQKAMSGYRTLQNEEKCPTTMKYMVLLGVDAATPGRLAVVEAKKIEETRYLENIRKWHKDCWWRHEKWRDGKRIVYYGMVGVKEIADLLFGIENNGSITIVDGNSKKLYAEVAKRILPCIWDGQRIPADYVERAINKASNPLAYKERRNWEQILQLACSMVKKRRKELYKEEWKMAVDKNCTERDYLYGRLLAVADRIEYRTFDMDKDRSRITNAKRYMNNFSQRPFETWKVIEENIQPYLSKLPVPERRFYENLLDEIEDAFESVNDYQENKRLSGLYLLGFHSQSCALRTYKQRKQRRNKEMSELKGKIDFTLFVSATNANPNGDPLNGNRPRINLDGYGEISDVCIKRKIRNRLQDLGQKIFVQSDDRTDDSFKSLKERADGCEELKKQMGNKKDASRDLCAQIACREWIDVRAFGQVFAFKGIPVSFGVRGPVSIHQAVSLSPIDIMSMQITKSVNSEAGKEGKASDTMGTKHRVGFAVYKVMGSVNVQLAEKTGFTQEDAEILKEALMTLFENDASSARPEGSMEVCRMYWWQHEEKTPAISSGKIQRGFDWNKDLDHPRSFKDYDITWNVEGCREPEIFDFV